MERTSKRFQKRVRYVKRKARSGIHIPHSFHVKNFHFGPNENLAFQLWLLLIIELKTDEAWHKFNFYSNFDERFCRNLPDNIERIDARQVSVDQFIDKYERPYKPCIITNTQTSWTAPEKWTLKVRLQSNPLGFTCVCFWLAS